MLIHDSCQSAIQSCLDSKTFVIARLYSGEKTMSIHIHDCYEVYFSIAGGEQFLIDNRVYEFQPGDIFFINQFESHYLSRVDQLTHERVVLSICPEYLRTLSTPRTNLNDCFTHRDAVHGHRLSLTEEEHKRFMYFVHRLSEDKSYGQALLAEGRPVAETCSLCGFGDYSNFLKAFTRAVGISPKKYASYTRD